MTMKQNVAENSERVVKHMTAEEIYQEFMGNVLDRVESAAGRLSDKLADERDPEKILALQKEFKRAARKVKVMNMLSGGISPLRAQDLVQSVSDPETQEELRPIFEMMIDLRCALNIFDREVRHENN